MPMKKIIVFLVIFGIFGCVAAEINYPARAVVIKVDKIVNRYSLNEVLKVKKVIFI